LWKANTWNSDAITIPYTDPDYCIFCTYYITVYADRRSSYSIVAAFEQSFQLTDGQPQRGHVDDGAMFYYEYRPADLTQEITVTLSNQLGLTQLYISTTGYPERTNPATWQWEADWFTSVKSIIINPEHPNSCHDFWCTYYIGVYGMSNASYSILAATYASTIPLIPNEPQRHHVEAGDWQYFNARIDNTGLDLSVVVTPLSGDPDIYVSRFTTRPNQTSYEKASTRYGGDVVDFDNAAIGVYYIGILAFQNTTFTAMALVAATGGSDTDTVIPLYDGQPQAAILHHGHYRYYQYAITGEHADITFVLTTEYGDPDL
jgi:hypothetical protein